LIHPEAAHQGSAVPSRERGSSWNTGLVPEPSLWRGSGRLDEFRQPRRGAWRRALRQPEMREDLANHGGLLGGGDDLLKSPSQQLTAHGRLPAK